MPLKKQCFQSLPVLSNYRKKFRFSSLIYFKVQRLKFREFFMFIMVYIIFDINYDFLALRIKI